MNTRYLVTCFITKLFTVFTMVVLFAVKAEAVPRFDLSGPVGSGMFGSSVTVLANGNIVVADPNFDITSPSLIQDVGAVYLIDGRTRTVISSITGSRANDRIGSGTGSAGTGIVAVSNSNFLIRSPNWDNGALANVGAITFCSGTSGCGGGSVSSANSLVGSNANDSIGSNANGVKVLSNGNYVLLNPGWNGARGSVTWGSKNTGVSGIISPSNSLVGSTPGDEVGTIGGSIDFTELPNGKYVVVSSGWNNSRGAVTLCDGIGATAGPVSSSNSLVGTAVSDSVGTGGIFVLPNGNFIVRNIFWDNGSLINAGAATFVNAAANLVGEVSASNSLVGGHAGDQIGNTGDSIVALANGNYIVKSPAWNDYRGAATFGNGTSGVSGVVSEANSLVGSTSYDRVGTYVTRLSNNNYVVRSPQWNSRGAVTWGSGVNGVQGVISEANSLIGVGLGSVGSDDVIALSNGNYVIISSTWMARGAVTWGNGAIGITGTISEANSLIGEQGSGIGGSGVFALPNGNYVVASERWDSPEVSDAGAVTICNGATGTTGKVTAQNSLVGSHYGDNVGEEGITVLPNGNFVVNSPRWNDSRGASTFVNAGIGLTGEVSPANSLIGTSAQDRVGLRTTVLGTGNYVVSSPSWKNGPLYSSGAATFGSGTTGVVGEVSESNSLIGSHSGDSIGNYILHLNGNYLVVAVQWHEHRGAVTFGSGTDGIRGIVSSGNSLVGTTASDSVGSMGEVQGITLLDNGGYVLGSPRWDNGSAVDAGAVTWCGSAGGCRGEISASNSLVGRTASDFVGGSVVKLSNGDYVIRNLAWDNGGAANVGAITYAPGNAPLRGEINSDNSLLGTAVNGGPSMVFGFDYSINQLVVGRPASNLVTFSPRNHRSSKYDFDGDGRADVSVFRSSSATWYLNRSTSGFGATTFGVPSDKIIPADYDGDGKTDIAAFRSGAWFTLRSSDNTFSYALFGDPGDVPVPADYDGDGKADQAIFRAGMWYLNRSTNGFAGVAFGVASDKPVAADYDGDGKTDIAVFRSGSWFILRSSDSAFAAVLFGDPGDVPIVADYDGDGKDDTAVFRSGIWYLNRSTGGFAAVAFGIGTDTPVPADYDGDGKADLAVFRNGAWYLSRTTAGFAALNFGDSGDTPIPATRLQ